MVNEYLGPGYQESEFKNQVSKITINRNFHFQKKVEKKRKVV